MRRALLWALVVVSGVAGAGVGITAIRAGTITGELFFALLPLIMVFSIAWNALSRNRG